MDESSPDHLVELIGNQRILASCTTTTGRIWGWVTDENANGLLRLYFPKGTDLSIHSQHDLDQAAYSLNTRPRRTLDWMTPSDKLAEALR